MFLGTGKFFRVKLGLYSLNTCVKIMLKVKCQHFPVGKIGHFLQIGGWPRKQKKNKSPRQKPDKGFDGVATEERFITSSLNFSLATISAKIQCLFSTTILQDYFILRFLPVKIPYIFFIGCYFPSTKILKDFFQNVFWKSNIH